MIDRSVAPDGFDRAVDDARHGGQDGLATLFRAYHPQLLRYLRAHEPRRADDLAGETWLAVAGRITDFDGNHQAFAAWLFTIARLRLVDLRRTGARRRTDPVSRLPDDRLGRSAEDQGIDALSAQDAVDLVVRVLSDDQAEVVLLRTLAGLSAREVGGLMGRDETWVRVTHHRAMRRLHQQLPTRAM
jgi:RNA polymerase sigma-70 factor (ECF subfamily)